jgi:hypothetical protein
MKIKTHNTRRSNSGNNWSILIYHSIEILFFIIRLLLLILFLLYKIVVLKLKLLSIHTDTHSWIFHFIEAIYLLTFDIIRTASRWAVSRSSSLTLTLAFLFLVLLVMILIILAQVTARWNIAAWRQIWATIITFLWRKWIKSFYSSCWRLKIGLTL